MTPPPIDSLPRPVDALFVRAADTPGGLAFEAPGECVAWGALLDGALRAASVLATRGVTAGARCAIVLPTGLDFLRAFLGVQLLGGVPVAMNLQLTPEQVSRRVDELACAIAVGRRAGGAAWPGPHVTPDELRAGEPAPRRALPAPSPEHLSHLQLTSGTTGEPRAAMIQHRNVMAVIRAATDLLEPRPGDRFVGWLPLHHDFGLVRFVLAPLVYGCPCALVEPGMATLPAWLETISRTGATITGAPDMAYRLASRLVPRNRVDLRSLRIATTGGEAVRASSIRLFEDHFGVPGLVRPGYGLAEATLTVTALRRGEALRLDGSGHVTCGRPMPDVVVRIAAEDGTAVAAGVPGRILVKGPGVFAGYLNDPDGTASVLRGEWLETGDIGAVDGDGHLFVHGRRRAMIKRGGAVIAPREIEEAVDRLPGVRRSAAVGLATDEGDTERVIVVVEAERGLDAEERARVCEAAVAATRVAVGFSPHEAVVVEPGAIPRTASGKTRYEELRRQLREREPPAATTSS